MILMTLLTAGILRQFHDRTPGSPFISGTVGSLLFAAIFFLLLVSAREWQLGATGGRRKGGIRLGSLTPLLLMLLIEKWVSLTLYDPLFYAVAPKIASAAEYDAWYRAMAGVLLILLCILLAAFSRPAGSRTWFRTRPSRFPIAAAATFVVVAATYGCLWLLSTVLGGGLTLEFPRMTSLALWILGGQAVLAFAEEVYYRGLILSELKRLAPRLGIRRAGLRRWFALTAMATLFGMEHIAPGSPGSEFARQMLFAFSLGLLFGLIAIVTNNLHYAAGIHAWINWLLLGTAPQFVNEAGVSVLPAGPYIGVGLILAFVMAMGMARLNRRQSSDPA
jgi:membrane protease YdiL (CAAX protease family)